MEAVRRSLSADENVDVCSGLNYKIAVQIKADVRFLSPFFSPMFETDSQTHVRASAVAETHPPTHSII